MSKAYEMAKERARKNKISLKAAQMRQLDAKKSRDAERRKMQRFINKELRGLPPEYKVRGSTCTIKGERVTFKADHCWISGCYPDEVGSYYLCVNIGKDRFSYSREEDFIKRLSECLI